MALTAGDVKFFAAAVQSDLDTAGGARSSTVVQNGIDNNLFPDVSAADRSAGMVRLRKVYPSLMNADTAPLLGGSVALNELPTDPATKVAMFAFGGASTTRLQALMGLKSFAGGILNNATAAFAFTAGVATVASATLTGCSVGSSVAAGMYMRVTVAGRQYFRLLLTVSGGSLTFDAPFPAAGTGCFGARIQELPNSTTAAKARIYSAAATTAACNSSDTVVLSSAHVQVAGLPDGAVVADALGETKPGFGQLWMPGSGAPGADYYNFGASVGMVPWVMVGDIVTLWHEATTTAATATNGGTVNVGRTNLDQLAIVGNDGKEIIRWLANGPTPTATSGAATANLATGIVTFTSVTGWSQPVKVAHRIAHRSSVFALSGPTVTLAAATTANFPINSVLSTHLPLGDVQAAVTLQFSQQAWTRTFSDTVIGNSLTAMYTGTITVTNAGAESDRWAFVFTSGNQFACYSERLGLVASGNTSTTFAPVNPATGAPFFSLPASGWAATQLVGSVFRLNTVAAAPPVWVLRSTAPSTAAGTTKAALRLFGSVDA